MVSNKKASIYDKQGKFIAKVEKGENDESNRITINVAGKTGDISEIEELTNIAGILDMAASIVNK